MRLLGRILYWVLVLAISVALLIVLVRFFEARDQSGIGVLTQLATPLWRVLLPPLT